MSYCVNDRIRCVFAVALYDEEEERLEKMTMVKIIVAYCTDILWNDQGTVTRGLIAHNFRFGGDGIAHKHSLKLCRCQMKK